MVTWVRGSSGKAQNGSYSSTCRRMPSFTVPFRRQGYNLGRGFVSTADEPGDRHGRTSVGTQRSEKSLEDRLDSWKEIAAYLKRDVTTVQRWEKREGMPVHRHLHDKGGSVYALTQELDDWIQSRRPRVDESEKKPEAEMPPAAPNVHGATAARRNSLWFALAAVLCMCVAAAAWLLFQHRSTVTAEPEDSIVGRVASAELVGDPTQEYLADGITEALIGRLANIHDLRVISTHP